MANTFTSLYVHVIFTTKQRRRWLLPENESSIWAVLGSIACDHKIKPIQIGGADDHIHALISMPPTLAVSTAVQRIKGASSRWMHEETGSKAFAWQDGYGAFSVSRSRISKVQEYIVGQREHHARHSFQDEFRTLLKRHDLEFDERYIWG
jgi:REP element-mobilizing transposase RayT